MAGAHEMNPGPHFTFQIFLNGRHGLAIQQVSLVQKDHIGASELVLEQFLQRAFMVKSLSDLALLLNGALVASEPAF